MKSLKITLILVAVFCLTIAGTNRTQETEPTVVEYQQLDKTTFEYIANLKKGHAKPTQEM